MNLPAYLEFAFIDVYRLDGGGKDSQKNVGQNNIFGVDFSERKDDPSFCDKVQDVVDFFLEKLMPELHKSWNDVIIRSDYKFREVLDVSDIALGMLLLYTTPKKNKQDKGVKIDSDDDVDQNNIDNNNNNSSNNKKTKEKLLKNDTICGIYNKLCNRMKSTLYKKVEPRMNRMNVAKTVNIGHVQRTGIDDPNGTIGFDYFRSEPSQCTSGYDSSFIGKQKTLDHDIVAKPNFMNANVFEVKYRTWRYRKFPSESSNKRSKKRKSIVDAETVLELNTDDWC